MANTAPITGRSIWVVVPDDSQGGQTRVMASLADGLLERGFAARLVILPCGPEDAVEFIPRLRTGDAVISATDERSSLALARARRTGTIGWWAASVHSWGPSEAGAHSTLTPPEARALACADALIVQCPAHEANLRRQVAAAPALVATIANGVAIPSAAEARRWRGEVREELGITAQTALITMMAQFDGRKRQDLVLAACRGMSPAVRGAACLLLAGDGPLRSGLAAELGTNVDGLRVLVPGHLEDPERVWAASDISVLQSDHEVLPMALLEAAAAGLPSVANSVGCIPMLAEGGTVSWVCGLDDMAQMVANLESLASDRGLRRHLGERARNDVAARFLRERMLDDWIALLDVSRPTP